MPVLVVRCGRLLTVVLGTACLAACPGANEPSDNLRCGVASTAELAPCPSARALEHHLRDRWALATTATVTTTCVPGRFGTAGWIIRATVGDEGRTRAATFVLQANCSALTEAELHDEPPGDDTHEAIDLDGDGTDEVIIRRSEVEPGGTSTHIDVPRVGSGRLVRSGKIRIAYAGTDPLLPAAGAVTCDGTVRYLARPDRGFFLEIDSVRSADTELCLPTGHHRFELGAGSLRRP